MNGSMKGLEIGGVGKRGANAPAGGSGAKISGQPLGDATTSPRPKPSVTVPKK